MTKNELTPFSEVPASDIDANQCIAQAQQMSDLLCKMNIKEATFTDGTYFRHNQKTDVVTISTEGVIYEQREHTTSLTFVNEGSSLNDALDELKADNFTQKVQGAFAGQSQSWVSVEHAQKEAPPADDKK